ncbi:serine palmitoyltransferase 2-like [Acropora millepora]|uniref:serine palmitoyltransferase 2-like n=2 Tax=Acropora millepora TaxID=45264 RepID=UPI001CF476E1|nr:serine palmitoyltransferase 2-like [Acropora millepora]
MTPSKNKSKMPVRSRLNSRRSQKSHKNGFSSEKNQLSALQEEKLKEFRESFVEEFQDAPLYAAVMSYLFYFYMVFFACIKDLMIRLGVRKSKRPKEYKNEGFAPLYPELEDFYFRNLYIRYSVAFNKPISSTPGPIVQVMEREVVDGGWQHRLTGVKTRMINTGSYNYLGFAENVGPCVEAAEEAVKKHGLACCSSRHEFGSLALHNELETLAARFVGKPAAIVFGMGFATNSTNIPTLVGKKDLIISDALNHSSLVTGARLSGATIRVFKHNDMKSLESVLRESVVKGNPRRHRPWGKILIIVEGVYSMEGSVLRLPEVVALKKKYKALLYLDEAHSIGAVGPNGRGVTDYFGVDPADVDIMMGTFTKSFGAAGGYIAATQEIIDHIRGSSHSAAYASSMSPPVAMQVMSSMKIIMGEDGTDEGKRRLKALDENNRYFRRRVKEMGYVVFGHHASPIIPLVIFAPGNITALYRELLEKKIALVGVTYPVIPSFTQCRFRICLSAGHTREMLDEILDALDEQGDFARAKMANHRK